MFEAILSLFLIAAVVVGVFHLATYLYYLYIAGPTEMSTTFYNFLDRLLILIIGLELIIMLVRHNDSSVVEVLIFAIAREILIRVNSMWEISLGIVALAGVLAIRKYLLVDTLGDEYYGYILGAAADLENVNRLMHIKIPQEDAETLGGFVALMAKERNKTLKPGCLLRHKSIECEILEMKDGVIEKVRVAKLN